MLELIFVSGWDLGRKLVLVVFNVSLVFSSIRHVESVSERRIGRA
jgi:hypothetical protein